MSPCCLKRQWPSSGSPLPSLLWVSGSCAALGPSLLGRFLGGGSYALPRDGCSLCNEGPPRRGNTDGKNKDPRGRRRVLDTRGCGQSNRRRGSRAADLDLPRTSRSSSVGSWAGVCAQKGNGLPAGSRCPGGEGLGAHCPWTGGDPQGFLLRGFPKSRPLAVSGETRGLGGASLPASGEKV